MDTQSKFVFPQEDTHTHGRVKRSCQVPGHDEEHEIEKKEAPSCV